MNDCAVVLNGRLAAAPIDEQPAAPPLLPPGPDVCSPCWRPQVCLLDLDYGLPVQVRDQALGMANEGLPQSDPGKEYALNRMQVGSFSSFTAHLAALLVAFRALLQPCCSPAIAALVPLCNRRQLHSSSAQQQTPSSLPGGCAG